MNIESIPSGYPIITLSSPETLRPCTYMIDSGSGLNLIKQSSVHLSVPWEDERTHSLRGISPDEVETLGSVMLSIMGKPTLFHVLRDSVNLNPDGILGNGFLHERNANVDYKNNCLHYDNSSVPFSKNFNVKIKGRTVSPFHLIVTNPEKQFGYVPRVTLTKGVYYGEAIVTNINGKAYLPIINENEIDYKVPVPYVELEDFETLKPDDDCESHHDNNEEIINELPTETRDDVLTESNLDKSISEAKEISIKSHDRHPTETIEAQTIEDVESTVETKEGKAVLENWENTSSLARPGVLVNYFNSEVNPRVLKTCVMGGKEAHFCLNYVTETPGHTVNNSVDNPIYFCDTDYYDDRLNNILPLLRLDHLNSEEKQNILSLVERHVDRFHLPQEKLGVTNAAQHFIPTINEVPIHVKQYRFPPIHKTEIDSQVHKLLSDGLIEMSTSPYNSPVWIVPKKPDSTGNKRWRMVIDYRNLNEKTIGDAYPLPNISDILDQLGNAKYFSVLDLASGFHQIPMAIKDAPKTAFSTPYGHYQFRRMPFGLKNAPSTFQRLMDNVLSGLQGNELFVYMDDIVIYAKSLEEHGVKFERLMKRLEKANLTLQPDKCEFLRREVAYLGHIICSDGVRPDPNKIKSVIDFPVLKTPKNIKQFLGLVGYYRRFIPNFSKIAKPLTDLLKKEATFVWQTKQIEAFEELKISLCSEPILQYPDFNKPFNLTTDASGYAIGGVLSQGQVGKDLPIAYTSRVLNKAEQNYSTIEKECLAIVYCVNHFRPYLYGQKFTIITDHKPLVWLHSVKDPTSRLWKWRLRLEEYEYVIQYKKGKLNSNADALSRNPTIDLIYPIGTLDEDEDSSSDESLFSASNKQDKKGKKTPSIKTKNDPQALKKKKNNEHLDDNVEYVDMTRNKNRDPRHPLAPDIDARNLDEETGNRNNNLDDTINDDNENDYDNNEDIGNSNYANTNNFDNDFDNGNNIDDNDDDDFDDDDSDEDNRPYQELIPREIVPYETGGDDIPPPVPERIRIIRTRDNLINCHDNHLIFILVNGTPYDSGALEYQRHNLLPEYQNLTYERANVRSRGRHHVLISIPIKFNHRILLEAQTLDNCLQSLVDVVTELGLPSISISKTDRFDDLPWRHVIKRIHEHLRNIHICVTVCENLIQSPTPQEREAIITENHSSALGGHKGVTKTYNRMRVNYYWNTMKRDIQEFIRKCRKCQIKKLTRVKTKQPMVITDTPGTAFDKISLDIMGPLPLTNRGNKYLLTIQDLLTKYSLAVPLRETSSLAIADAFLKNFICVYGAPRSILTDQGSNFLSAFIRNLTRKFNIQHYKTTAYHPQSNASLERSHHVLMEYLRTQVEKEENWDNYIELAMFSYNTSVHEGTQYSPYELIFGKLARLPSAHMPIDVNLELTYQEYLEDLFDKIRDLQETARRNLIQAKQRSKTYYDKRINPKTFVVGANVFLLKEPFKGKFATQYSGPYRVVEELPNNNVKILINDRPRVVHTDKLKLSHIEPP
jgi:transposase InsO family protein